MNTAVILMVLTTFAGSAYIHRGESRINRCMICLAFMLCLVFFTQLPSSASVALQSVKALIFIALLIDFSSHIAYLAFVPRKTLAHSEKLIEALTAEKPQQVHLGCYGKRISEVFHNFRLVGYQEDWETKTVQVRFYSGTTTERVTYIPFAYEGWAAFTYSSHLIALSNLLQTKDYKLEYHPITTVHEVAGSKWFSPPKLNLTTDWYLTIEVSNVVFPSLPPPKT